MSTLAIRDDAHRDMTIPAPGGGVDPTGGRLVAWAEGLSAAHRIASALCSTAFAPAHFRGKPDEAAAAILFGDEIGFSPTQALNNIHVISGKPGMYARAMVALVQSKGHEVWTEESTPVKVVVCGRRRGTQHTERDEWTIDRARKAGYTSNKKYEQDPQAMLYARAASGVCRRIAADALAGLAHTVEELELDEKPQTRTVTRGSTGGGKVQRRPAPAAPEPGFDQDDAPAPAPTEGETGEAATEDQLKRIGALFPDAGLPDGRTTEGKERRRGYITRVIDRDIEKAADLTTAEADTVIAALEADHADEQWTNTEGGEG